MAAALEWTRLDWLRRPWAIAGAILIAILAIWFFFFRGDGDVEPYRTVAADRGQISRVVGATGSLQPLVSVNVGSTVSGLAETVEVDFNSTVRAGQVLARLEPATFQQRVAQSQATLRQAQAEYGVANSDYARYARLAQAGFASDQLMAQQRAARASAAASVQAAQAALASVQVDLDRSVIRSPIDGVVVDRQINPGQSVAASFQAPTLFVIAQDLSRLQANITVDEADIGEVREGQRVRFNVDAFPDEEFEGRVSQVRQQGVDTNGVVSYTVVVQADNPGRRLLPGMTANAEIIVEETAQVARIPNAALRFRPGDERLQLQAREMTGQGGQSQGGQGQGGQGQSGSGERARQNGAVASEGSGQRGQGRGGQQIERLTAQLQLTPAQQAQARAAMQTARQGAGQGQGQGAGDRRAAARRVRDAVIAAIRPTLTPAQHALLAASAAAGSGGGQRRETPTRTAVVFVLRDNRPVPVRVQLGVADDSYTELRGGDLREGDQIITSGGPQPAANTQQQRPGANPLGGGPRIRGV